MELILENNDDKKANVILAENLLPINVGGGALSENDILRFEFPLTIDGGGDVIEAFASEEAYQKHLADNPRDAALKTTEKNGAIFTHRPFNRIVDKSGTQLALGTLGSLSSRGHLLDDSTPFKGCLKLKGSPESVMRELFKQLPENATSLTLKVKAKATVKTRFGDANVVGFVLEKQKELGVLRLPILFFFSHQTSLLQVFSIIRKICCRCQYKM